jgi:hypothetical protein
VAHYFGSIDKARRELRMNQKLLNGWSKTKIVEVIAERQRSGKPLKYSVVRRERVALTSAAEAYFGSWGRALACGRNRSKPILCPPEMASRVNRNGIV